MRLVEIDTIHPAAYNPREVDHARLNIVKLSLQKLGFLSPVYVTQQAKSDAPCTFGVSVCVQFAIFPQVAMGSEPRLPLPPR